MIKRKNTDLNQYFFVCSPKKISANLYARSAEFNPQSKDLPAKVSAQAKKEFKLKNILK